MFKALIFSFIAALCVFAAFWITQQPGSIVVNWLGYELTAPVSILFLFLVIVSGLLYIIVWLGYALILTPHRIRKAQENERRKNGYKALTRGMAALAAGDALEAQRHAQKATQLMNDPPLTLLLTAQAAQISGDEQAAAKYFRLMLDNPDSAFLGYRGLLMQSLRQKNYKSALTYTREALKIRPKADWLAQTQFELETKLGEWSGANNSLKLLKHARKLPSAQLERYEGILLTESARQDLQDQPAIAAEKAENVQKYIPHFIPALILQVKAWQRSDKKKPFAKFLERQWQVVQHPTLLQLYCNLFDQESPANQFNRLQKLAGGNLNLPSDQLLILATTAIKAQAWSDARQYLQQILHNGHKTAKACRLMAELEEKENQNYRAAIQWLTQASEAPEEATWICQICHTSHVEWQACCSNCREFDQLVWRYPPSSSPGIENNMIISLTSAGDKNDKTSQMSSNIALPPPQQAISETNSASLAADITSVSQQKTDNPTNLAPHTYTDAKSAIEAARQIS